MVFERKHMFLNATPYGTRPTRWLRPILLSLLLVALDEQGLVAMLLAALLILIHLPRTLVAAKYRECRQERLIRWAIYLTAIFMVFALRYYNVSLAKERADQIIVAVEAFVVHHGKYPDKLTELVPQFIPEIPAKAKWTLLDSGFRYMNALDSPSLMYVVMPPFGRRVYHFETRQWSDLD
jgi:hypothetical protein